MAGISRETIDQVNATVNILEVVSKYLHVDRRNKAICPFHDDTRPSLSIKPEDGIFNCFTCGTKGGAIKFIELKENMSFPDAVETLANMYNIPIKYTSKAGQQNYNTGTQMKEIHDIAKNLYHKNLYSDLGNICLKYIQSRDISNEMIKEFELGYSLLNDNTLHELIKGKYPSDVVNNTKLFDYSQGKYVDFFRGRFVIPIKNNKNETIGFNARRLPGSDLKQKYKNSFDSIVYKKSNILFGLDKTKNYILEKKSVIMVEGPTDLIRLYQNNIKNVVASCGTAFPDSQAKEIKKNTNNVYINFDSDEKFSGQNSAIKAGYKLLRIGIEPRIIDLPTGNDPDDFIKNNGIDAYLEYVKNAKKLLEFEFENYNLRNQENATPQDFVDIVKVKIAEITDPIYRELAIKNLSEVIGVSIDSILNVINQFNDKKNRFKTQQIKNKPKLISKFLLEDDLIRICLSKDYETRKFIFNNLNINWIRSEIHKKIYEILFTHLTSQKLPDMKILVNNFYESDTNERFVKIILDLKHSFNDKKVAIDCLKRLEKNNIQIELNGIREKIKDPSNQDLENNLKDLQNLEKQLNQIKNKYNDF